MVTGSYHHVGLGVAGLDAPANVGYTGSRVTPAGFLKDVFGRNVGQLLTHQGHIFLISHNPDVLQWTEIAKTLISELQQ